MKIGIIGIGNIGGTLARRLSAAGHRVTIADFKGAQCVRSFAEASTLSMQARWTSRGDIIQLNHP